MRVSLFRSWTYPINESSFFPAMVRAGIWIKRFQKVPLPPGTVIDSKFEVISVLGHGGFATVYLAKQLELDRQVAVKLMSSPVDLATRARFQREAQILVGLNHPNMIRCYGHGIWNGCPYIVLQYVDGTSLQEILPAGKPLKWQRAVRIITELSLALSYVNQHGIMHRDIKAANIILCAPETANETVKLIDFGLAKLLPNWSKAAQMLTAEGQFIGTAIYMSPEQCRGEQVTVTADIYSVGCLLFHCLSGAPPFDGDHSSIIMHRHLNEPLPQLPEHIPVTIRNSVSAIIARATKKNPLERYNSFSELIDDLSLLETHEAVDTTGDTRVPLIVPKKKLGKASLASLVVLSVVAAVYVLTNHAATLEPANTDNLAMIEKSAVQRTIGQLEQSASSSNSRDFARLVADSMDATRSATVTNWLLYLQLASHLAELNECEKSLIVLDRITEIYPRAAFYREYCIERYKTLFLLGRETAATEQRNRALGVSKPPRDVSLTHYHLGVFEFSKKLWANSLSDLGQSQEADPKYFYEHLSGVALPCMVVDADFLGRETEADHYLQRLEKERDVLRTRGADKDYIFCDAASSFTRSSGHPSHAARLEAIALYIRSNQKANEQAVRLR